MAPEPPDANAAQQPPYPTARPTSPRIQLLYTGGTIGMRQGPGGSLQPATLDNLRQLEPSLDKLECSLDFHPFETPIDSSNMEPARWLRLAQHIRSHSSAYDGFVILHGTDTMAYTASALSFLLRGLNKPVILTGSQLPLDVLRSDARDNLITAVEIASHPTHRLAEVAIYFHGRLLRGNRSRKYSSEDFQAFHSPNYPNLAEVGVQMQFHPGNLLPPQRNEATQPQRLSSQVGLVYFFPGLAWSHAAHLLQDPQLQACVLLSYGNGNLPNHPELLRIFERAQRAGLLLLNISQTDAGAVQQGRYQTSSQLEEVGVLSGRDMTPEAALTKLMFLLGYNLNEAELRQAVTTPLCGEMTDSNPPQQDSSPLPGA